jgi:hypothetical protein
MELMFALLVGSNLVLEVNLSVAKVLKRFFPTQAKSNFIKPLVNKSGQVFFHHDGTHPFLSETMESAETKSGGLTEIALFARYLRWQTEVNPTSPCSVSR